MLHINSLRSCCVAPNQPLWHLWQYCIALHLRDCSQFCTLWQTLNSQCQILTTEGVRRWSDEEEKGGWGAMRQAGSWRNALSGSCSALFVRFSATCVEKKSVQETRTAGEVLGDILKQTKHYPALNLSRCFFSTFQEYSLSVENILYISKLLCITGARV